VLGEDGILSAGNDNQGTGGNEAGKIPHVEKQADVTVGGDLTVTGVPTVRACSHFSFSGDFFYSPRTNSEISR
jgi:hypothetical protein